MATTIIRTCDLCEREIPNTVVFFNAGVYGREAHIECVDLLNAYQLVSFLNLDDIKIMRHDDWQGAVQATGRGSDWKKAVQERRKAINDSMTLGN